MCVCVCACVQVCLQTLGYMFVYVQLYVRLHGLERERERECQELDEVVCRKPKTHVLTHTACMHVSIHKHAVSPFPMTPTSLSLFITLRLCYSLCVYNQHVLLMMLCVGCGAYLNIPSTSLCQLPYHSVMCIVTVCVCYTAVQNNIIASLQHVICMQYTSAIFSLGQSIL